MSALRTASNIALGASDCRKPARILVFACELPSLSLRNALEEMKINPQTTNISPVLFGDGASAFILCNEFAPEAESKAIYEVINRACEFVPDTIEEMSIQVGSNGNSILDVRKNLCIDI